MAAAPGSAPLVVVMGVTSVGKSVVGRPLAKRLQVDFGEGDDFHPRGNVEKMAVGHPLDDDDRRPWLKIIGSWLAERAETGAVVSCSALKRRYRDTLRAAAPSTLFLHLDGDRALIEQRMAARKGHFMPTSMLDSQFAALELLGPDEAGIVVDVESSVDEIIDEFLAWWHAYLPTARRG